MLPVDGHDPPATAVVEQLNAVDSAHERFGIVAFVARLVRAPNMRDVTELLGATRNFLFEESILFDIIADARDETVDVQYLRRNLAAEAFSPAFSAVGIKRAPGINNERSRFQSRLPGGPEIESYAAVIIASIDATSAGLADGIFDVRGLTFDASARLQRSILSSVPLHSALSSLHCAPECR